MENNKSLNMKTAGNNNLIRRPKKNEGKIIKEILANIKKELLKLEGLDVDKKVSTLNLIKEMLTEHSPMIAEPVDIVRWVKSELVIANDYNPNRVAPPEMRLLELSIKQDGYTQPIVVYKEDEYYTVVDGFHRNRVGKECKEINARIKDYLPVVIIDKPLQDRMASTIRHNRARGTHAIQPMSKVIEELYFLGWSDKKIAEQLGMEKDEVLRLKQFTGLGNLFRHRKFSKAWE
ncbi:MAG: IbrB-like domain-containing protein [Candidatus Hodarchaeales archaeon]